MILKTYKLLKIRSSNLLTKTRSDPTPPKGGPYTIQSKSHGFIWRLCSGTHKLHYFMIIILKMRGSHINKHPKNHALT